MQSKICINKKVVYLSSIIILFLLFLLGYSSLSQSLLSRKISTSSRASAPEDNPSIVNGELALDNEFPYFVKIESSRGLCGGTLISEEFILTAAHCVYDDYINGGVIKVIIGVNHYNREYSGHYAGFAKHSPSKPANTNGKIDNPFTKKIKIYGYPESIYIPLEYDDPWQFNKWSDSYDVAILKLGVKATGIPTLSIPDETIGKELIDGYPATVIGIGWTKVDGGPTDQLMKATLNIDTYRLQPKSIIFLSSKDKPAKNTCLGDSGGPVIIEDGSGKKYIVGTTSAGKCEKGESYYTSTAFHSKWIKEVTHIFPNSGTATKDISLHPTQHPLSSNCSAQKDETACDVNSRDSKIYPCYWDRTEGKCKQAGN